jgi:hypothetical protein
MRTLAEQEILDVDLDPRLVDVVWGDWDMFEVDHDIDFGPLFFEDWLDWDHPGLLPNPILPDAVSEDPTEDEAKALLDRLDPAGYYVVMPDEPDESFCPCPSPAGMG